MGMQTHVSLLFIIYYIKQNIFSISRKVRIFAIVKKSFYEVD